VFEGFFSDAADLLKKGVDKVKGGFKKLKDSTMEVLKKAWKWVSDAISAAFDFIVAQGKKAFVFEVDDVQETLPDVVDQFRF
jgi:hypothetical protein